jgi:hypothetical protein
MFLYWHQACFQLLLGIDFWFFCPPSYDGRNRFSSCSCLSRFMTVILIILNFSVPECANRKWRMWLENRRLSLTLTTVTANQVLNLRKLQDFGSVSWIGAGHKKCMSRLQCYFVVVGMYTYRLCLAHLYHHVLLGCARPSITFLYLQFKISFNDWTLNPQFELITDCRYNRLLVIIMTI